MGTRTDRQTADELGRLIARSRRLLFSAAARQLEAHGESMLVWQALNRLRHEGPLTQCQLAFQTAQHPAGISRLLDALEREGLVKRERDREDRRKLRVQLTARALARLEEIDPHVNEAANQVLAPLSAAEQRTLRGLLRKLVGEA